MKTSSEKSNAPKDAPSASRPGRWTREEARVYGRRGGIARWAVKPEEDDGDERTAQAEAVEG